MLEALGVPDVEETVYLRLLQRPGRTSREIAAELNLGQTRVSQAISDLEHRGLVDELGTQPQHWSAVPPDVAIESLVLRREEELHRTRGRINELMKTYRRGQAAPGAAELVEVITGREAINSRWRQMRSGAREQVWLFDKAPYVESDSTDHELELNLLAKGVSYRAIYECSCLREPGRLNMISTLVEAGEHACMLPELPFKLAIVDRRWALVPMYAGAELDSALVVQPSSLLDALASMFELHWRKGMPIPDPERPWPNGDVPADLDRRLLALLAAGFTDESMARQLGISVRTVQRRVRALMDRLEARTRFQAGIQAARAGWL
jgi:DNA-binding CsgD family transcriptional regulator